MLDLFSACVNTLLMESLADTDIQTHENTISPGSLDAHNSALIIFAA